MPDSKTLKERVKELTCLYNISSLNEKELTAHEIVKESVHHLTRAVQFPENCIAVVLFNGEEYGNRNSVSSVSTIHSEVETAYNGKLKITLYYRKDDKIPEGDLLFLVEEKALLDSVCRQIASKIEWIYAQKILEAKQATQNRSYLNANIGSWEYDFRLQKLYLSDVLKTLLELDGHKDLLPSDLFLFIPTEKDRERFKADIKKAIELQKPFNNELYIQTAKNSQIWVKIVGEPQFEGDECIKIFGTVQNIQRRKQVEKILSLRNHFIETALDHLPIGIAINTISDGKNRLMNQKFSEIYGWPEAELKDVETFFQKVYPDKEYRERISKRITEDIESRDVSRMNWEGIEITRETGEKRVVNAKNIPVYDQDLMISSVTDVTEQFRMEQQLRANERRFKALVQDGSDLIAILNLRGEFTYVSPTSTLILGIKPENAIGKKMIDFVHRGDQGLIKGIMKNLPHRRRFVIEEVRFKSQGNHYKWLEASVTNMLHEPSVEGFVINAHDITERINHQNEIKKALAEKEVLLSEIHHRVKNNLAVISGMMQLQLYDEANLDVQAKLNDGMLRIQTMANIHELLYSTKSFAKLSFAEVIKKLAKNVMGAMCSNKKVGLNIDSGVIELNINQAIPCALIVNEVLTNIFKHAFKGRKEGNIEISMNKKGKKVDLIIIDDGIGLPEGSNLNDSQSLGKNIIKILSEQLEADFKLFNNGNGTTFELHFEADDIPMFN